ncbi:thioredoxin family protein [Roseiconus lacunae]|uniref:Thioredoxin domain-containing protein n=1 Tax=Roseiconus lacunae TaxID=2605694 RepID=A0ABT7PF30_9BACT|nr:thioredoxin domain-containing protein [Roseiconus lacunae]MDM4015092.1 thioredoxin domain-containing protein [Roseiconus lacunae]
MFAVGCSSQTSPSDTRESRVVIEVSDQSFHREVLEADEPVLVDMWAPWCQPCVEMKPAFRDAAELLQGEIKVVEINVQENPFINEKYGINQLPTLMLFRHGDVVEKSAGARSVDALLDFVRPFRRNDNIQGKGSVQN